MDRLIMLEPSAEVVIRIEPGQQRSVGWLTLRNLMHTMPVAFRFLPLNRFRFAIHPRIGILAPLSTLAVEIAYLPPPPPSPFLPDLIPHSGETIYIDSVICAAALAGKKLRSVPSRWFDPKKNLLYTDSGLSVFFAGSAVLAQLIQAGDMDGSRAVLDRSDPTWKPADSVDPRGRSLLHLAVALGRADLVMLLIEYGADVDARSHGRSPVEAAVDGGETLIAELLRSRAAAGRIDGPMDTSRGRDFGGLERAIESKDGSGWTAMILAGFKGRTEVIRVLKLRLQRVAAEAAPRRRSWRRMRDAVGR